MKNLYKGKSVASMELMTLEVVDELINTQRIRLIVADIDEKHRHLVDVKINELYEMDRDLYATEFKEILRIKDSLKKEIDDFLESVR